MRAHHMIGLLASISAAVLLVACQAAGGGGPMPSPSSTGLGAPITGTADCSLLDQVVEPGTSDCTFTASDLRLSGTARESVTFGPGDFMISFYGSYTLQAEGGQWNCQFAGHFAGTAEVTGLAGRDAVCYGKGGYFGHTAYVHSQMRGDGQHWGFVAWIEAST